MTIYAFRVPSKDGESSTIESMTQQQKNALDALELNLDLASIGNMKAMRQYALEKSTDFSLKARQRATWKRIAAMVKAELK